jgi:UDP-N-acetylenolpyruvoylglucosamine reductase
MTTVKTGGNAEFFARANTVTDLDRLHEWARAHGVPVSVIGQGSNLLVADEGVDGLVI